MDTLMRAYVCVAYVCVSDTHVHLYTHTLVNTMDTLMP
jgi:hypothetical protein